MQSDDVQQTNPIAGQFYRLSSEKNSQRLVSSEEFSSTKTLSERSNSVRVVIIGSGLAGLAAAQRLYDSNSIDDVILLEAQNRIGGRVHTIEHSNFVLELGAQWLHGAQDNPLYKWLSELEMLDDFQDASLGFSGKFCVEREQKDSLKYHQNNVDQIKDELIKRVLEILNESKWNLSNDVNYLRKFSEANQKFVKNLTSASQVFRCELERQIEEDELLFNNKQLVYSIFDWFLRYETIENCCDSMDEVSVESYTNWNDLGDGTLLNFKRGYSSLLAWFCQRFPAKNWLYLEKEVLNIELITGGNGKVRIKYKNSAAESESKCLYLDCDHVIVTASIGFLKQNLDRFFTPELPAIKAELIKSIGFGTVNKILLQFERPFWLQDTTQSIKLVWNSCQMPSKGQKQHPKLPAWARDIISFDVVRRQPNLLIGWIGGQGARLMELESDQEVGRICLEVLDCFLPSRQHRSAKLVGCLCSRWNSNRFTCGSYSFQSTASSNKRLEKLHEPIYDTQAVDMITMSGATSSRLRVPRILFAGEATAGDLYSTTHGAIISGWREADRLIDYFKSANSNRQSNGVEANQNLETSHEWT